MFIPCHSQKRAPNRSSRCPVGLHRSPGDANALAVREEAIHQTGGRGRAHIACRRCWNAHVFGAHVFGGGERERCAGRAERTSVVLACARGKRKEVCVCVLFCLNVLCVVWLQKTTWSTMDSRSSFMRKHGSLSMMSFFFSATSCLFTCTLQVSHWF